MIVIFHSQDGQSHCDDGFAAAWVVRKRYGDDVTFYPGVYGNQPPFEQCNGEDVVLVDFSYKRDDLKEVIRRSKSTVVLDHHRTAAMELHDIAGDEDLAGHEHKVGVQFDMDRSGAILAWDWCFPYDPPPELLLRIEDNDLWREPRRFGDSLYEQAALRSYPQTFEVWDQLMQRQIDSLAEEGQAIRRFIEQKCAEIVRTSRLRYIGGVWMLVCNAPWCFASEVAGKLAEEDPDGHAAVYFDQPDQRVFSLRSRGDVDVSEIAKKYGGGGHKHAAGFQVNHADPLGRFDRVDEDP